MEFAAEAAAWHLDDACREKRRARRREKEREADLYSGSRAPLAKEKRRALRARISDTAPVVPSALMPSFFSDEERDRYPRLYYKYTCNSASSPTECSHRIPTYLPIRRSSVYLYVETTRAIACIRVRCRWHRAQRASVPYLSLYNTDILQKATEAKRGTTFLLSLRLPPRVLSLSLSPSLVRARGIKYNKDIQWELIGDISTYLPFTRGSLLPPVHNAGMRRRCRDARFASLPPFYVPFFSATPSRFFFFRRRRPNRDIFRGGIISRPSRFFSGCNAPPRPRHRCVALRCAASSNTAVSYLSLPSSRWVLNEPVPVRIFG